MGLLHKRWPYILESQADLCATGLHRICHHPRTVPFGAPQPHEGFLFVVGQGDAPVGKVENEVGKNDAMIKNPAKLAAYRRKKAGRTFALPASHYLIILSSHPLTRSTRKPNFCHRRRRQSCRRSASISRCAAAGRQPADGCRDDPIRRRRPRSCCAERS